MESKEDLSWEVIEFDNEAQIDYYFELLEEEVNNDIFTKLEEFKKIIWFNTVSNEHFIRPGYILFLKGRVYNNILQYEHRKVTTDYDRASELYEQSIQLENPYAMNNLGFMYEYGELPLNYNRTIELYTQAIKLGLSNSIHHLRGIIKKFNIMPINYIKIFKLIYCFKILKRHEGSSAYIDRLGAVNYFLKKFQEIISSYNSKLINFQLLNFNKTKFHNYKLKFI